MIIEYFHQLIIIYIGKKGLREIMIRTITRWTSVVPATILWLTTNFLSQLSVDCAAWQIGAVKSCPSLQVSWGYCLCIQVFAQAMIKIIISHWMRQKINQQLLLVLLYNLFNYKQELKSLGLLCSDKKSPSMLLSWPKAWHNIIQR